MSGQAEGACLIDKPSGVTSHDVVDRVRKALATRKVGHAGTLDPMATGLLVIGVGRATRLLRFLGELPKTYEGSLLLGVETDTLDSTGEVIARREVDVSPSGLAEVLRGLEGASMQTPPAYSAVKVDGRRMYQAARKGQALQAEPRQIRVDSFRLGSIAGPAAEFDVVCSGGTYVRSLVAEVGRRLGCGAHMTSLRRTGIGPFRVEDADPPDRPRVLPLDRIVAHLARLDLSEEEANAARHGRILAPSGSGGLHAVYGPDGRLIGVYTDEGTKAVPQVILQ